MYSIYSKCVFCSKTDARNNLCAGRPSHEAKSELADAFPQNIFPYYLNWKWEHWLKVQEPFRIWFQSRRNSLTPKKINKSPAKKICNKKKTTFLTWLLYTFKA
jgi:hypothetical protein